MPFARILGALFGGGDDVFGLNELLDNHALAWVLGLAFILLCSIPPLISAFKAINDNKRWLWFLGFLILPFVIEVIVIIGILNSVLQAGFLKEEWILSSPILVTLWPILVTVIFLISKRNIGKLLTEK